MRNVNCNHYSTKTKKSLFAVVFSWVDSAGRQWTEQECKSADGCGVLRRLVNGKVAAR